jgi:hypothetical protein
MPNEGPVDPEKDEDHGEETSESRGPGVETEGGAGPAPPVREGPGHVEVKGEPVVPVRIPRPPPRDSDRSPDAPTGKGRGGLHLIDKLPGRIGGWVLGTVDRFGAVKLGLVSKHYKSRADELVLDEDDVDLLNEAFAGPFKKILKLIGLTSEEISMIVVGILIILPRIAVVVDEESGKAKAKADAKKGLIPHGTK